MQTKTDRPRVVTRVAEVQQFVRSQQRSGQRVGLVPTMGALHEGHLSLVRRSNEECDATVVTIFVNPLQFGPREDFSKYPRTLERDLELLGPLGVDLVFTPTVEEMYPAGFATNVDVGSVAKPWEGGARPGHFRGVATIVLKLFNAAPADRAYFGQKDYQQALVVRQMVRDLNLPVEIVVCPIVREADGLALSSRNAYLSGEERQQALTLSRSLRAAREMFVGGVRDAARIIGGMRKVLAAEPAVQVDYATVADPLSLAELKQIDSSAVALVAARVGATRLIDNEVLGQPVI